MESKDIEAQLKSLIGLDLGKSQTGSLPIVKGKEYFFVKLSVESRVEIANTQLYILDIWLTKLVI